MSGMDIKEVLQYLPHRYPFLLIDRVLDCEPGKRIVALKNVTINEHFFAGHFPHHPIMPGVMIIEALAQAAAILSFRTMAHKADRRLDLLLRRHRRRPLQAPGRPRGRADSRRHSQAPGPQPVAVQRRGAGKRRRGGRGAADVHAAQRRRRQERRVSGEDPAP